MKKNSRKVSEWSCRFLTTPDEVKNYVDLIGKLPEAKIIMQSRSYDNWVCAYNIKALNLFDPELQLINTKPVIKNILKGLLGELKKFKVHTNLLFKNKNINDHKPMHKIFHPTAKLLLNDSDINKAFRSLNQSTMTKIKNLSQQRFSCETS